MLKKIFNHQTSSTTLAAFILGVSGLINGILALLRDRLLAGHFGASQLLDVYFAAFRIPDFIYGVLIAGGVISVFLPIFSEYYNQNKEKGWYFTNIVLNCFLLLLFFLCLFFLIFIPFITRFIVPGFNEENKNLFIYLTRIMLFSPLFFVFSSVFSGILHYFNRFLTYAVAPILYNLSIILGILFFVPLFGIKGLAYGVVLGALLHFCIQIPPAVLAGFRYRFVLNFDFPGLKKIFKLLIPRTIGSAVDDFNLIIITAIASMLAAGSISVFNFSNNLQRFPITLIGVSLATAVFPVLAKTWAGGNRKEFLGKIFSIFRQIIFITTPLSFLMFLLRAQIIRLILGTGQFGWLETRLTAASFGIFSFGLCVFCLIPLMARVFFSLQDTKTPVTIGIISIILNIILCFSLIWLFGFPNILRDFFVDFLKLHGIQNIQVIGLPLALFLSGSFNFYLLFIFFNKKIMGIEDLAPILKTKIKELFTFSIKIFTAVFLMAIVAYFALQIAAPLVNMQTFLGVFFQTIIAVSSGVFVYVLVSYLLKLSEIKSLWLFISGRFLRNKNENNSN